MPFLNAIYSLKRVFISIEIGIAEMDVVMSILVPTKCYVRCGHNIIYYMTLSTE